ncbi:4-hydroxy-2-oxoheptanedioate aldolase [Bordetella avium]|uniref:2,4-dihydroxyhept-2-ene-1,7-dioic acid aldolase n=1 Tax=Bordetella avium (strain 197N) TaxID=360910 RepID=Q2L322_BORA1|nr:4-hydroxy-2-oxoheptanedioate aldolase [Bordetella avium]RIQ54576.1 4-hydroxy-2-oxoheptanedioate aldolase [Bordetella avium]RIQ70928.1 4-hydroxy-2-oxoheptanedioate aldolase [Bordetella avium]CAJ48867.1 2,4-dihydroxyhept-2-ene-1,7-dioic acid aldolase [Bordetella avium 197N]
MSLSMPRNTFKEALQEGRVQIGLWVGLADAYAAEALAATGFDWLLLDAEHAPNDLRTMLGQLQAVAPYPVHPIVRPVIGDVPLIKQYLDVGAQTLLIPVVETAEQAAQMVAAMRYPPRGIRGVGSALARASRWNQIDHYLAQADEQMCLLVQVETRKGLENLEAISRVEGVDGVFFGPADLSASLGLLGQAGHSDVRAAIIQGIQCVRAAGKSPGVLSADPEAARSYLEAGALFVAVGVDTSLLVRAARELAATFRETSSPPQRASLSGNGY